jgi:hypothetical protein
MPGSALMLNLETIYTDVDITFQPGTDLYGPGCVIAAGDIAFQPNLMTGEEAYILLMSIEGTIQFQPNNDFYGSVAGDVDVILQPDAGLYWVEPDPGLEYPECPTLETISYEIK